MHSEYHVLLPGGFDYLLPVNFLLPYGFNRFSRGYLMLYQRGSQSLSRKKETVDDHTSLLRSLISTPPSRPCLLHPSLCRSPRRLSIGHFLMNIYGTVIFDLNAILTFYTLVNLQLVIDLQRVMNWRTARASAWIWRIVFCRLAVFIRLLPVSFLHAYKSNRLLMRLSHALLKRIPVSLENIDC